MISILIYDPDEEEMSSVINTYRNEIAYQSDEEDQFLKCQTMTELEKTIEENDIGNICVISFDEATGKSIVSQVRKKFPVIVLMLIVDDSLSPRAYIRPGILASAVLFRPHSDEDITVTVKELVTNYLVEICGKKDDLLFTIESKEGITRIPFEKINYFEAASKRVFVRLFREDYRYNDTLESLEKQLPEFFIRCHRSYIVNLHRISRFIASEYVVVLDNGMQVPVSRTYRDVLEERIR